jgi:hypothetical protein
MPFDGTPKPDLSVPTLEGLIYLLEHEEEWPRGFRFSWESCHHCAMGLLARKFPDRVSEPRTGIIAPLLGLSKRDAEWLFLCHPAVEGFSAPTPHDMAQHIRVLALALGAGAVLSSWAGT